MATYRYHVGLFLVHDTMIITALAEDGDENKTNARDGKAIFIRR